MKRLIIGLSGAGMLFALGIGAAALASTPNQAETQSGAQVQPSKPAGAVSTAADKSKTKKVWTDDDLAAIRTPSDVQGDEDAEARRKEIAAAAQPAVKPPAPAPTKLSDNSPLPTTVEENEREISIRQRERDEIAAALAETTQAYNDTADEDRGEKLKYTMGLQQDELREADADLKLLQTRLEELKKAPSKPNAQSSPASSQSGNGSGTSQN